jgi:hypothetical protein
MNISIDWNRMISRKILSFIVPRISKPPKKLFKVVFVEVMVKIALVSFDGSTIGDP